MICYRITNKENISKNGGFCSSPGQNFVVVHVSLEEIPKTGVKKSTRPLVMSEI